MNLMPTRVPVKIGILGISRGYHFLKAMAYAPSAKLAGVCSRHPEQLAKTVRNNWKLDVPVYATYADMLDADIDAIIVATPVGLHAEHAIAALRAGKHVLSEVGAATSLEQCQALLAAVKASGGTYMLAENFYYMRSWQLLCRLVAAGLLGELYYAEGDLLFRMAAFVQPAPNDHWITQEWAMRQGHPYSSHYLGPLLKVFQERIQTVVCCGSGRHYAPWVRADDTSVVLCNTPSGKLIKLRVDFFSASPEERVGVLFVQGTKGCCKIYSTGIDDDARQKIYIENVTPKGQWQSLWDYKEYLPAAWWDAMPPEVLRRSYDSGLPLLIEEFAQSIIHQTRPPIDIIDALNITAPGLVSEQSRQRGGQPVDVPEFT